MATRRGNNEGSIYWNKRRQCYDGQYPYIDSTGKNRRKKITGKSKKEVATKAKLFLEAQKNINDTATITYTLANWAEEWLAIYVKNHVKIKTYERYSCAFKQHITPYIGNLELTDLTTAKIQKHLLFLKEKGKVKGGGLSALTVNNARRVLISALNCATDLGYIPKNPAQKTKSFKSEKQELQVLTKEQGKKLLECANEISSTAGLMVSIALKTGMRLGEICGLQWDSISFDSSIISVRQTVVATNHGPIRQNTTKTSNSYRNVPIPNSLIEELINHKNWQIEWKETLGDKYIDNNFVLTNDYGHYIDPSYFSHRIFKKALKKAGIDKSFRFHDCRHTHATWLLNADVNVKAVSERLGHSSIRITLDIYSHVLKTMQDKAVDAVENLFK